ncbi:hypothetical protein OS493_036445 [Desmophyllum pertusum]|uniref:Uncharacterized protein n=1 Tax=Desmophyllum pertusum TaxID=174260 RepID=A0A9W9YHZ1_9CNID|nr:hypothetical protein OS493_036445 [Desmophyllum pertusum]
MALWTRRGQVEARKDIKNIKKGTRTLGLRHSTASWIKLGSQSKSLERQASKGQMDISEERYKISTASYLNDFFRE